MAERIPQSVGIRVPLQAYLSSDHVSPATGKTIAITISKNGGAYGNPSAGATNATGIANGSYYVDLSTTDTGTLGPLFVRGTEADTDTIVTIYNVVAATNAGFTALPAAAADAAGGLPISDAGGLDLDARLDAAITSRMASYTQPTGFLTATFPATVASTTNITGGTITTVTNLTNAPTAGDFTSTMKTSIGTAVAASAVASVTGNVGGNVTGSVGSVVGLTASNLDATISSRLASASYTVPPTTTENADELLNRDMSAVSDTNARSPLNALRFLRNKWDSSGGTLIVKKEDDSTTAWTGSVSSDAAAIPIVGLDPS